MNAPARPPPAPTTLIGVVASLCAVLGWSVMSVSTRGQIATHGHDAATLTLVQLAAGGVFLLAVSGARGFERAAIRLPSTWVIGLFRVISATAFTAALGYAGAGKVTLLSVLNVPLGALGVWFLFGRGVTALGLAGHGVIVACLAGLAMSLDGGFANPAVLCLMISESSVIVASVVSERHPLNQGAGVRLRAQLTGTIMVIVALGFLALWTIVSLAAPAGMVPLLDLAAARASLADPWLWVMAPAIGILARGPAMYCALHAIRALGTERYMLILTGMPIASLALEQGAVAAGLLPATPVHWYDLAFALTMAAAAALVIRSR